MATMLQRGFTLVEVLMTVAIVGILAAVGISNYGASMQRARWDAARDILLTIYAGEQVYFTQNGRVSYYPTAAVSGTTCTVTAPFTECIGVCSGAAIACRNGWRNNIYVDDPNLDGVVAFDVQSAGGATPLFQAKATYNGQTTMTVDQDRVFSFVGTEWVRP